MKPTRWYYKVPDSFHAFGPTKPMFKYEMIDFIKLKFSTRWEQIEIWRA